ncbi:amino acid permease [Gleimia hominis]|uniref:Amino acid permease n=1 Tax=Gleimia hominis TaxID=595468 RepID=A0ABU3IBH2_9ACTO|nr:amino acid permease [Gleimia hominis]MDT3767732.1 amino acid permease [Gleimia hominis]
MAKSSSINTLARTRASHTRPLANVARASATTSMLLIIPLWHANATLNVLQPLGYLAIPGALWMTIFAMPFVIIMAYSATGIYRARSRHTGDFAFTSDTLGHRWAVLNAGALLVEHAAAFALVAATGALAVVTAVPAAAPMRVPIALFIAIAVAITASLRTTRNYRLAAAIAIIAFALMVFYGMIAMNVAPVFAGAPSESLERVRAAVSAQDTATIPLALLSCFAICLSPAVFLRHLTSDLRSFARPRAYNAGVFISVCAIAISLLLIGVAFGIADVDSHYLVPDSGALIGALRAISVPEWQISIFAFALALAALTAARSLVDGATDLVDELSHAHLLPENASRDMRDTGLIPLVYTAVAAIILIGFSGQVHAIVPLVVLPGFVSYALTRWASVKHWKTNLRLEGHPHERRVMKRARIGAFAGLLTSLVALVATVVADAVNGAWIAVGLLAIAYVILYLFRRYDVNERVHASESPVPLGEHAGRIHALIAAPDFGPATIHAAKLTAAMRPYRVEYVHVDEGGTDLEDTYEAWQQGRSDIDLTLLAASGTRSAHAFIDHVRRIRAGHPGQLVNVVVPHAQLRTRLRTRTYNRQNRYLRRILMREPGVVVSTITWKTNGKES